MRKVCWLILAIVVISFQACLKKSTVPLKPSLSFSKIIDTVYRVSDSNSSLSFIATFGYTVSINSLKAPRTIIKKIELKDLNNKVNISFDEIPPVGPGINIVDAEKGSIDLGIRTSSIHNKVKVGDSIKWQARLLDYQEQYSDWIDLPIIPVKP